LPLVYRALFESSHARHDVVGLCADDFVFQDPAYSPTRRLLYIGDGSRIRGVCGWEQAIAFHDLVRAMADAQSSELKQSSLR
jgi:hypothetical protein